MQKLVGVSFWIYNMLGQCIIPINNASLTQVVGAKEIRVLDENLQVKHHGFTQERFIYEILIITFDSNYRCDCNKRSFLLKLILLLKKRKKRISKPRIHERQI